VGHTSGYAGSSMTADGHPQQENDAALEREAIAWLVRVTDEDATPADRAALQRWQAANPAHAQAFAKAGDLWQAMPSAVATALKSGEISLPAPIQSSADFGGRRGFIIGLGTAALAAVGYAVIDPPLGLWPSLSALTADYRTATGQRRRITISKAVSVEMNTQTSIALRSAAGAFHSFELVTGEAIVGAAPDGARPVLVMAADGLTTAEAANFDIRCDGATASVTCLNGTIRVQYRDYAVTLTPKQQVSYGDGDMSATKEIDPAVVTAWRDGYLMFRKEPLARVIAEVNRYRPGRILLLDGKLGQSLVTARFRLDRLDDVIAQIRDVFGAAVRTFPGGLVLIG
jgi:transmembrane sensor